MFMDSSWQNDSESSYDTDDSDKVCPTWLKNTNRKQIISPDVLKRGDFTRRRRVVDGGLPMRIQLAQKNQSPPKLDLSDDFGFSQFRSFLLHFLEEELSYFKEISIVIRVFQHLQSTERLQFFFSPIEQNLIFNTTYQLKECCGKFIKTLVSHLRSTIHISDFHNSQELSLKDTEDLKEISYPFITHLVHNCEIANTNFGALFSDYISSTNFKSAIISYFSANKFRIDVIKSKIGNEDAFTYELLRVATLECSDKTLLDLLSAPVERMQRYPALIKNMADSLPNKQLTLKQDMFLSLLKINKLLERCRQQRQVGSWQEFNQIEHIVKSQEGSKRSELQEYMNQPLDTPNDMKLVVAGKNSEMITNNPSRNIVGPESPLIDKVREDSTSILYSFKGKYDSLKKLEGKLLAYNVELIKFMRVQVNYAEIWHEFLHEDNHEHQNNLHFVTSIYSSYLEKIRLQMTYTQATVERIDRSIIRPVSIALEQCEEIRAQTNAQRKLRGAYVEYVKLLESHKKDSLNSKKVSRAKSCIKIENLIKQKLPIFLENLDELVDCLLATFNFINCQWLSKVINHRSLEEYTELLDARSSSQQLSPHQDIVKTYKDTFEMTKNAIKETACNFPGVLYLFSVIPENH